MKVSFLFFIIKGIFYEEKKRARSLIFRLTFRSVASKYKIILIGFEISHSFFRVQLKTSIIILPTINDSESVEFLSITESH